MRSRALGCCEIVGCAWNADCALSLRFCVWRFWGLREVLVCVMDRSPGRVRGAV